MNRLAHWMMRMYPARWRRRYGDELDALLADTGADVRVVADLMRGGVRMQFSTWSFTKLAVTLGLGGLLLAGAGSFLIANTYRSSARVLSQRPAEMIAQIEPLVLSRSELSSVINDPRLLLYRNELKTRPLENVIEEMRRDISIEPVVLPGAAGASAFDIAFQYPDRAGAQQTVAALIDKFRVASDALRSERAHAPGQAHFLNVVDVPNLPVWAYFPDRRLVTWTGSLLGVLLVFGWRRFRKKRIATWGFAVSAVAMALVGNFAGTLLSFQARDGGANLLGNRYRSTALISAANATPDQLGALFTEVQSRTSLSTVINDPRLLLYKSELKTEPLEDVIETMRHHLSIVPVSGNGHYFTVSFEYGDRFKAQQTVRVMVNRLYDANREAAAGLPDTPEAPAAWGKLAVLDPPSFSARPVAPNRLLIAVTGGLAGLFLAALISLARHRWNPEGEIPLDAVNG